MNPKASDGAEQSRPPLVVKDENRVAFHMEEFKALKSEIAELVKTASSSLQYALAASGAITAWLITSKKPDDVEKLIFPLAPEKLQLAFLLPILITAAFGSLAAAAYRRIKIKGQYLRKLEGHLAAEGLGWEEEFVKKSGSIGHIHIIAWVGLVLFDLAIASLVLVNVRAGP